MSAIERVLSIRSTSRRVAIGAVCAASMLGSGCSDWVGIRHVGADRSAKQIAANALTTGEPSASTMLVLRSNGLAERYEVDPGGALHEVHRIALESRSRGTAFALAELAFLVAREEEDRALYLTSACWSWFCLFDASLGPQFDPTDPRMRLCCDLYNRTVAEALKDDEGTIRLVAGKRALEGDENVELSVDLRSVQFDLTKLTRYLPAEEYEVHGLVNRHRAPGIGAPIIAATPADDAGPLTLREALSRPTCAGASLLLRLEGGVDALAAGTLDGTLELHQPALETAVTVGDVSIPLEFDMSATIAYFVQGSRLLDFELRAFFGGIEDDEYAGIYAPMPYTRGKIPIVLVHGTNSSLARWASMLNDLFADASIRSRIQIWFFTYPSGVPLPISADRLRTAIMEYRRQCDPTGTDSALDSMLMIGHSQGGLLARQVVVDDAKREIWDTFFTKPIDQLDLDAETRDIAQRVFFPQPLACVKRAIYIASPHLGSYQADRFYTRIANALVTIPKDLVDAGSQLLLQNRDAVREGLENRSPSALNGMRTDNPFLLALAKLPVSAGVHQHCICAIGGDETPPDGGDGVVMYSSANLEGVDSTFLVRDSHSCQSNPLVINEVRRILREHLADFDRRIVTGSPDR